MALLSQGSQGNWCFGGNGWGDAGGNTAVAPRLGSLLAQWGVLCGHQGLGWEQHPLGGYGMLHTWTETGWEMLRTLLQEGPALSPLLPRELLCKERRSEKPQGLAC